MAQLFTKGGALPEPLPFRITLPDGRTRTDPATFTAEEIASAGYVAADPKPTPGANQVVAWGGGDWTLRDRTPEEIANELAALRYGALQQIRAAYSTAMRPISDAYPPEEREGWPEQIEAAKAVVAGDSSPLIDALAAPRGLTALEMANRVLQKQAEYRVVYAAMTANLHRLSGLLEAATSAADLEQIDVNSGWDPSAA